MPRLINKQYVKSRFAYTWYIFVLLALILPFIWIWSFAIMHQPLAYEKVHTFFSAGLLDANIGIKVQEKIGSNKLKAYELQAAEPGNISFENRFTTIGLNTSDILIIENDVAKRVKMSDFFITLDEDIVNTYFKDSKEFYVQEEKTYGIKFNKNSWTKNYINYLNDKDYYLFINKVSHGIGKYQEGENPSHTLAFEVASLYMKENI